jgi:ABC-type antimicrobial peptide transport system ATPase subunit
MYIAQFLHNCPKKGQIISFFAKASPLWMNIPLVFRLGLRSPFGEQQSIMVMVDDAGIDVRSAHKKKLEHPVSIDKPRPAAPALARRVQASTTIIIISSQDLKTRDVTE